MSPTLDFAAVGMLQAIKNNKVHILAWCYVSCTHIKPAEREHGGRALPDKPHANRGK